MLDVFGLCVAADPRVAPNNSGFLFSLIFSPSAQHQTRQSPRGSSRGLPSILFPEQKFLRQYINLLNAKLYPICHLLALLGAHYILHVSRLRVNQLTG
jgi:hypothetical protein